MCVTDTKENKALCGIRKKNCNEMLYENSKKVKNQNSENISM